MRNVSVLSALHIDQLISTWNSLITLAHIREYSHICILGIITYPIRAELENTCDRRLVVEIARLHSVKLSLACAKADVVDLQFVTHKQHKKL